MHESVQCADRDGDCRVRPGRSIFRLVERARAGGRWRSPNEVKKRQIALPWDGLVACGILANTYIRVRGAEEADDCSDAALNSKRAWYQLPMVMSGYGIGWRVPFGMVDWN